jgi:hypothetical protein
MSPYNSFFLYQIKLLLYIDKYLLSIIISSTFFDQSYSQLYLALTYIDILLIILLVVSETSGETLVFLVFAINLLWYIPELVYCTDYHQG